MAVPQAQPTAAEVAATRAVAPQILVLMGVSGSGKSTIARELRRLLGWPFQEGDDLHPPANVAKMHSGQPLNDDDRRPWLQAIARWIDQRLAADEPGLVTCSDLKRAYRDITIGGRKGVRLVYLKGDRRVLRARLEGRQHHFMPPSLLRSQMETLEEPGPDEHPLVVDIAGEPAETALKILRGLAAG